MNLQQEIQIPEEALVRVAQQPLLFRDVVLDLAGVTLHPEIPRSSEDIEAMRLCRNALSSALSARRQHHVDNMIHNATANVKQPKSPYFAG